MLEYLLAVKGKVHSTACHERTEGQLRYNYTLDLTSVLDGFEWLIPRPGRSNPGYNAIPTVQWAGCENFARTVIRSPDLPARSESLYLHLPRETKEVPATLESSSPSPDRGSNLALPGRKARSRDHLGTKNRRRASTKVSPGRLWKPRETLGHPVWLQASTNIT